MRKEIFVTVVLEADYNSYYANTARTVYLGRTSSLAEKALKCMNEVYDMALKLTKPKTRFINVIRELNKVYGKCDLKEHRVIGYTHSVGLQVEKPPITTILPSW